MYCQTGLNFRVAQWAHGHDGLQSWTWTWLSSTLHPNPTCVCVCQCVNVCVGVCVCVFGPNCLSVCLYCLSSCLYCPWNACLRVNARVFEETVHRMKGSKARTCVSWWVCLVTFFVCLSVCESVTLTSGRGSFWVPVYLRCLWYTLPTPHWNSRLSSLCGNLMKRSETYGRAESEVTLTLAQEPPCVIVVEP